MHARVVLICGLPSLVSLALIAWLPGVLADPWVVLVRALAGSLALVLVAVVVRRRLTNVQVVCFCVYAQGVFAVLSLAMRDPQLRILEALGVLVPPLLLCIVVVVRLRWVAVHVCVAVVLAVTLTQAVTPTGPHDLVWVLSVTLLVACPSIIVMIMRHQLDQALRRARHYAVTDPLTGLLNRRGMYERLPALIDAAARTGAPLAALVIDVDRFKRLNDRLGHSQGDRVLADVAGRVQELSRPTDLVVRLGGEEMLVMTTADGQTGAVSVRAERIRRAVASSTSHGTPAVVTVSIGVATRHVDPGRAQRDVDQLIASADERMYAAKAAGRNSVRDHSSAPPASDRPCSPSATSFSIAVD